MVIKKDSVVSFFLASTAIGVAISYSKLYLFHFSVIVLLIYFLISVLKNNLTFIKPILPTSYHLLLPLMLLWYALTIFWSIDKRLTLEYLFYISCGILISFVIIYYAKDVERQVKVFNVVGLVFCLEVIFSLLESFTSFRLPISPYSELVHFFGRESTSGNLINSEALNTPTGFQWNPNNLAVAMSIMFPFFLMNKKLSVKFLGSITVFLVILYTGSRSAVIASIITYLLYVFFVNKKRALLFGTFFLSVTTMIFIFIAPNLENHDNYKIRRAYSSFSSAINFFSDDYQYQSDSIGVRKKLIERGIDGLKNSYGVGVGGGASRALGDIYGIESMHNFWIEIIVEAGILFFVVFTFWYLSLLVRLIEVIRRGDTKLKYFATSSFLAMIGFIFSAVSASSVIYFFPMWLLFGFAIATINNYKKSNTVTQFLKRTSI